MAEVRMTREVVRRVKDLLHLTGCSDLEQLALYASLWADPSGDEFADIYSDCAEPDDTSVGFDVGWHYEYIDFPITLGQFWRFVEKCYAIKMRHTRLLDLPDWDPDEPYLDVTEHLAAFFEVHTRTLVDRIGGSWHAIDRQPLDEWLDGEQAIERWLATGVPAQALLGLATTAAVVAVPDPLLRGHAKEEPSRWWIPIGTRAQLKDLGLAVEQAAKERRAQFIRCKGCRRELAPEDRRVMCPACVEAYPRT